MFKTKEELIEERKSLGLNMYGTGILFAFKSFAERVEFYKKYRTYPPYDNSGYVIAHSEHPEFIRLYSKSKCGCWNDWLFDYCFGDVIE